ncbi:MAG: ATP-binding protein [Lentimicrobium sp.]|jgi:hypothetical protein|nr:ATP-binding protein [Lentimicrobium sp.]
MKDLSLHILDIVQNSISAGATEIKISILENQGKDQYLIEITDNGRGINADDLGRVTDPFFTSRTTRKVGMGLPLLKQNAERTGGNMSISSTPGKGTSINAIFGLSNIDRPSMGDIGGTLAMLISSNPIIRFIYSHTTAAGSFKLDTNEVIEMLDGMSIASAPVYNFLKEMINENLMEIQFS